MSTVPESAEDPGPVIEPDMEDESWFWSDENQEGYREALEDLEHGRY